MGSNPELYLKDSVTDTDESMASCYTINLQHPNTLSPVTEPTTGDFSSISSFSTLTSSSKLITDDIDFINFYFENERRAKLSEGRRSNGGGEEIVLRSTPCSTSPFLFLDCSPIPKIDFDEMRSVMFSSPESFYQLRTSPASSPDEITCNTLVNPNNSSLSPSVSSESGFPFAAPVNSPNATTDTKTLELDRGRPIYINKIETRDEDHSYVDSHLDGGWKWNRSINRNDDIPRDNNYYYGIIRGEKEERRPRLPCVGQEFSPESDEFNFPKTKETERINDASTMTFESDIDTTDIHPPSPILINSARKVDSWLIHTSKTKFTDVDNISKTLDNVYATARRLEPTSDRRNKSNQMNNGDDNERSRVQFTTSDKSWRPLGSSSFLRCRETRRSKNTTTRLEVWDLDCDAKPNSRFNSDENSDDRQRRCSKEQRRKIPSSDADLGSQTSRRSTQFFARAEGRYSRCRCCPKDVSVIHHVSAASASASASVVVTSPRCHASTAMRPTSKKQLVPTRSRKNFLAKKLKAISSYIKQKKTSSKMTFKTLAIV